MKKNLIVLGLLLTLASMVALAPAAFAAATPNSFNLIKPNTSTAPSGDTIRVTGSGTFDTTAKSIVASGSFTHTDSTGAIVARGTWMATGFTSFKSFGGPNPGTQGGVLWFTATLFPDGGAPHLGILMSITCLVGLGPGHGFEEGTTVGVFTDVTGGTTLFHID
jgi:hypothetical protein